MATGQQVKNGKAFEFAIAQSYFTYLNSIGINAQLIRDTAFYNAQKSFDTFPDSHKETFVKSAEATIATMMKIEPGFTSQKNDTDILTIRIATDSEGIGGDVRDIIFQRKAANWEIGFSTKNNNDAVKHSRLSNILDFGQKWLDVPVSRTYWDEISPVFNLIATTMKESPGATWNDLGNRKITDVYIPLLNAFKHELLKIDNENIDIPQKLISYLIGNHPFYKIIKDDGYNMVIVKAFNINNKLNKSVYNNKAQYRTHPINLPTRIVEFDFNYSRTSDNTLNMILDGGWEISFRIHNASTKLEQSLKFDIQLIGNPPVLFTQYIFQE